MAEIHREFDRSLHVAFLDIKAAFDSVDRQALWKALRSRGIPNILLDLIVALREHTGSSVRHGGKLSTRFPTTSGVRQGCVLAPALFCVAIDWILNHMDANPGIRVGSSRVARLLTRPAGRVGSENVQKRAGRVQFGQRPKFNFKVP